MSLVERGAQAMRRVAAAVAGLLPEPPTTEAPPPDVDGRRQGEVDAGARRRVERASKVGKGGYR